MITNSRKGKYKEAVYYSPQYKMGVKVLGETQMENIFPSYENLIRRVEEHRSHVGVYGKNKGSLDEQYNLMFDNVFSIMGRRGSGKTSVVYTLKKIFEDMKETDVVLPIVMSELIPESSEIIGWILALLENTVTKLDTFFENEKNREGLFKDCMVKTKHSIKQKYNDIKELCFSKSYVGASEDSFSRVVANSERKTQNTFDFSHRLAGFWTDLRECICMVNGLKEEEPLIYIIFDDVDLAPEKVWELLSTIVKYLSHPNVVVIVTADEEMLYEVVKNILFIKVKKGDIVQEVPNAYSWFREMAKLYVDKILPPSTRYYIENFENCGRKASFVTQLEFEKNGEIKRQVRLKEFLEEQIGSYLIYIKSKNVKNDFLHYQGKFLEVYLLFWGDTSRQLGNECLIVEQLISNLKTLYDKYGSGKGGGNRVSFFDELYHTVYYFVFSTLNANSNAVLMSQEIKALTDELIQFQPDDWGIYINYRYLQDRFNHEFRNRSYSQEEPSDKNEQEGDKDFTLLRYVSENIMLYMLLFFVENLLMETEAWFKDTKAKKRSKVHGQRHIVAMLDTCTPQDYSLVRCNADSFRLQEFLYEYGKILENPELLNSFDMMSESRVRKYFDALPEESLPMEKMYDYCVNNPNWFRTMVKAIYLMKTGIYDVTKVMLVGLSTDRFRKLHDRGIEFLDRKEIDLMCSHLENPRLLVPETVVYNVIFQNPDKNLFLDEKWNTCRTIIDLKLCIEESIGQNVNVLSGMRAYYSLLCNMSHGKYEKFFASIIEAGIATGINVITSEIMNMMNGFTWYEIIGKHEYDECIKEIEMITGIWYDGWEITEENNTLIDIDYVNSLLRTVMVKSLSEDRNYWFGRHEQLNNCYAKLKGMLQLSLLREQDKENALYLILLKELRMYMKCYELSLFFRRQKGAESRYIKNNKIYEDFYKYIKRISGKSDNNNQIQDKSTEANVIYIKELINSYIREGVRQYVGSLLGEDV